MGNKIIIRATDPDGIVIVDEVDEDKFKAKRAASESRGMKYEVLPPGTPLQPYVDAPSMVEQGLNDVGAAAKAALTPDASTSPFDSAIGGLLQGVSLGAEDELRGLAGGNAAEIEALRMAQEKENPSIYGASKFIAGLLPHIGIPLVAGSAGSALGGPLGALGGAVLGAAGSSALDTRMSSPQEDRASAGDVVKEGVIGGALEALTAGAGKLIRRAGRVPSEAMSKVDVAGRELALKNKEVSKRAAEAAKDIAKAEAEAEVAKQATKLPNVTKVMAFMSRVKGKGSQEELEAAAKMADDAATELMKAREAAGVTKAAKEAIDKELAALAKEKAALQLKERAAVSQLADQELKPTTNQLAIAAALREGELSESRRERLSRNR